VKGRRVILLTTQFLACVSACWTALAVPGDFVLISDTSSNRIVKVDVTDNTIVDALNLASRPVALVAPKWNRIAYSFLESGSLLAINPDSMDKAEIVISGFTGIPLSAAISSDGATLAVTTLGLDGIPSHDDQLSLVALESGSWPPTASLAQSLAVGTNPVDVCIAPDDSIAVVCVRDEPAVRIVSLTNMQETAFQPWIPPSARPDSVTPHPAENVMYVTGIQSNRLNVLDLVNSTLIASSPMVDSTLTSASMSGGSFLPDGMRFLAFSESRPEVYDLDTSDVLNPVQLFASTLILEFPGASVVWLPADRAYVSDRQGQLADGVTLLENVTSNTTVLGRALTGLHVEGQATYFNVFREMENSAFGFHPASTVDTETGEHDHTDALNIGVDWTRVLHQALWRELQPDLGRTFYTFGSLDDHWGSVPREIEIVTSIGPEGAEQTGYCETNSWKPIDEEQYIAFVETTVERYDGDGVNDMPGLVNPIRYWQVGNEPNHGRYGARTNDFDYLHRITWQAIRRADPSARVILAGMGNGPAPVGFLTNFDAAFAPILERLGGNYADVFDFHWYGDASGHYRMQDQATGADLLEHMRDAIEDTGIAPGIPIWVTEMGSYSSPVETPEVKAQTEREHAQDLMKRMIYGSSRGIKRIFPAFGMTEGFEKIPGDDYFDHTGLIYDGVGEGDPGYGVRKLAYYSYRRLAESMNPDDWQSITNSQDGLESGTYVYVCRTEVADPSVAFAWWDYYDDPSYQGEGHKTSVELTGLPGPLVVVSKLVPTVSQGKDVDDYANAFRSDTYPVSNGYATIVLDEDPVIIYAEDMSLWFKCDEISGTTAIDDSGHGHNGTINGAALGQAGPFDNAYGFDETNDYVTVPDFAYGPEFTLSLWFRLDDAEGSLEQRIFSHGALGTPGSLNVYVSETAALTDPNSLNVSLVGTNAGAASAQLVVADAHADGMWHSLVLVASSTNCVLYLDGAESASSAWDSSGFDPAADVFIGATAVIMEESSFGGDLDELRIYNRSLYSNEIERLYLSISTVNLVVSSDRGDPSPPVGVHSYDYGSVLLCETTASYPEGNGTQQVCTGWIGTGSVLSSGTLFRTGPVRIEQDSAITWLWGTNFALALSTNGAGNVYGPTGSWHRAGSVVELTASPNPATEFSGWSGDLPSGSEMDNPLSVLMDRARSITAGFSQPPTAILTASPTSGVAPLSVTLDASVSIDPDGNIVLNTWDFDGDGIYEHEGSNIEDHVYYEGTYTSRVVVTDNDGISDTGEVVITVSPDTLPPSVSHVGALGPTTIEITYSEPMEQLTTRDVSHYALSPGVRIYSALMSSEDTKVILRVSPMVDGSYTLYISDVKDLSGHYIPPGTQVPFTYRDKDLLAYDGFDDGTTGALSGQTGGEGWQGSWNGPTTLEVSSLATALLYTNGPMISVLGSNRAVMANSDSGGVVFRYLTEARGYQKTYISFLIRLEGTVVGARNHMSVGALQTLGSTDGMSAGLGSSGGISMLSADNRYCVSMAATSSFEGPELMSGTTHFFVLECAGDEQSAWTNARLYVDPTSADVPQADFTNSVTSPSATDDVAMVAIKSLMIGPDVTMYIDELRVGSTWPSVIPRRLNVPTNGVAVGVTNSVDNPVPDTGETLVFTVSVSNAGPDAATNVDIDDVLPPVVMHAGHIASQGAYDATSGVWSVGTLTSNETATLTISTIALSPAETYYTNWAVLASLDQEDVNPGNNSAFVVLRPPPLEEWRRSMFTPAQLEDESVSGDDADPDGDGHTNIDEFYTGTYPTNAASVLAIVDIDRDPGGDIRVTWSSVNGRKYSVLRSEELETTPLTLIDDIISDQTGPLIFTDSTTYEGASVFYYIKVEP
jgi:uncharacterized repeat protein (TIGR01451 family)